MTQKCTINFIGFITAIVAMQGREKPICYTTDVAAHAPTLGISSPTASLPLFPMSENHRAYICTNVDKST